MKNLILFLLTTILLFGCAGMSKDPQLVAPGPFPDQYEATIRDYLSVRLYDPDSLKDFVVLEPPKEVRGSSVLSGVPYGEHYWHVVVSFRAKNRFGGYTGARPHYVLIKYGNVVFCEDWRPSVKSVS